MMKRIKLLSFPVGIIEHTDRWGVTIGKYSISGSPFYLDEEQWNEINEFQSFKPVMAGENDPRQIVNYHDMERLLTRAGNRAIWEFNAYANAVPSEGDEEYIRSFAAFGDKRIVEYKKIHDVQRFLLSPIVYSLNLWSYYFGENKKYRKWLT